MTPVFVEGSNKSCKDEAAQNTKSNQDASEKHDNYLQLPQEIAKTPDKKTKIKESTTQKKNKKKSDKKKLT